MSGLRFILRNSRKFSKNVVVGYNVYFENKGKKRFKVSFV